ncbi:hypothetical protein SCT_1465 [Sulfuricella sp. T08]|uniref:hypothetical protein n=1 Tax=Sulfuricella sp. T08 TaxID=1632857 RepID=UPI0006179B28|nr:hypothetical protein [Sulfuricella sp. T08]GAO36066.1 hypothetical protein SCT_1465 [Sulfuricella sp. T08]
MKRTHCSGVLAGIISGMLVWFALAANAAQAEEKRVESGSTLAETALYERALKREEEQAALRAAAWQVQNHARDARAAAARHRDKLKALQDAAQARSEAFSRVSKAALQAEQAKRAAVAAVADYTQAAEKALQAAAAFAEARGTQRGPRAQAADAAAARKVQALQQAQAAREAAVWASDSLRSALSSVGYHSAQLSAGLPQARATADAFAAKGGELVDAINKARPNTLSREVMSDSAQVAERAVQLRDEAGALTGRLKLVRDLSGEMKLAQEQEPAHAAALQGYYEAALNAVIEADAHSYAAAVSLASLKRCQRGSACRMQLDEELAAAAKLRLAARDEAAARLRSAMASIDATVYIGRRIDEYAEVAEADPRTLDAAVASAAAGEALAEKVRVAAFSDYQRAAEAYEQAKRAADAAYLAAYGQPRRGEEVKTMAAEPAPRPEPTASMMSPRWQVEAHAWEFFTASAHEAKGYGAYTYVLFGRRLGSKLAPQVQRSYAALLDAVIGSTPHRTEVSPNIPHAKLNLFCIPGKTEWDEGLAALDEGGDKFPALDNYASSLALATLSTAGSGAVRSSEILGVIQDSPGPFLLTTMQPMQLVQSGSPMLFVDLSRFPPETYADLVTAYKRALVERPPPGQQTWQPPAFQWVAATGTGVAGHLLKVKNAVSGWFSFGEGKPVKTALR